MVIFMTKSEADEGWEKRRPYEAEEFSKRETTTLLYGPYLGSPMLLERQMNTFWKRKIIYIISRSINASRTRNLYKALAHLTHEFHPNEAHIPQ